MNTGPPSSAMQGSGSVRFVVDSIALNKCVGLATSVSAVIHLQYASRSCRGLHVGMLVAGFCRDQLQTVCT